MILKSPDSFKNSPQVIEQTHVDEGLRQYMLRVYNYMALGLVLSGAVAWAIMTYPAFQSLFFGAVETAQGPVLRLNFLGMVAVFAPLAIILFASFRARQLSASTMQILYWAFVALQGIGLSVIFQAYTGESVVRVLFITAGAFAGLSLYGYTTRRDLSPLGAFMNMGLWGLLIAIIVGWFWHAPGLQFVISVVGVIVFAGLTAYETQAIKEQYAQEYSPEILAKSAIWGAWGLYLDFLNLFLFLLRLMGNRK